MVRQALLAALLALFSLPLWAQEIETSVDRNELARGETLTYTIRVFDRARFAASTAPWSPGPTIS